MNRTRRTDSDPRCRRPIVLMFAALAIAWIGACCRTAPAATFYAAPGGTGDGKTAATPTTLGNALALCGAGGTVQLTPGQYPYTALYYQCRKTLIGGGAARFDGLFLRDCVGVTVEGVTSASATRSAFEVYGGAANVFRRCIGTGAGPGNTSIFEWHYTSGNLAEDCAGWGQCRTVFSNSQYVSYGIWRRCFGMFTGSPDKGIKSVFQLDYNGNGNKAVNCIGIWAAGATEPGVLKGIFATSGNYDDFPTGMYSGTQFLGCMAIARAGARFNHGAISSYRSNGQTFRACLVRSYEPSAYALFLIRNDHDPRLGIDLVCDRIATFGGKSEVEKPWIGEILERLPIPQTRWNEAAVGDPNGDRVPQWAGDANHDGVTDVGDLGILSANWGKAVEKYSGADFTGDGKVDGADLAILSANIGKPLWPWPMQQQILDASGGLYDVQRIVREAFGQ